MHRSGGSRGIQWTGWWITNKDRDKSWAQSPSIVLSSPTAPPASSPGTGGAVHHGPWQTNTMGQCQDQIPQLSPYTGSMGASHGLWEEAAGFKRCLLSVINVIWKLVLWSILCILKRFFSTYYVQAFERSNLSIWNQPCATLFVPCLDQHITGPVDIWWVKLTCPLANTHDQLTDPWHHTTKRERITLRFLHVLKL